MTALLRHEKSTGVIPMLHMFLISHTINITGVAILRINIIKVNASMMISVAFLSAHIKFE